MENTFMRNYREITMDDIYVEAYNADRCLTAFEEQYFSRPDYSFDKDENAKLQFVCDYEYMQAQLWSIGQHLFEIRVKLEFALGIDSEQTRSRMLNEIGMMKMNKKLWKEFMETELTEAQNSAS